MNIKQSRTLREVLRTGGLLLIATVLLHLTSYKLPESELGPVLTSSAILLYIVAFSHITRRIILPSLDIRHFLAEALKGNVAASIVVASVLGVFVALVTAGISLLR